MLRKPVRQERWLSQRTWREIEAPRKTIEAQVARFGRKDAVVTDAGATNRDWTPTGGSVNSALTNSTTVRAHRGIKDGIRFNAVNPCSIAAERSQIRVKTSADARDPQTSRSKHGCRTGPDEVR
ncbi:MAG: hypothetical protein ABIU96_00060 [Rhodanobacter sp.]